MSFSCLVMALHIFCIYRLHFGLIMHGAISTEFQCCLKQSNRLWMPTTVMFVFFLKECDIWLPFISFFLGKAQHKSLGQTETSMRALAFDNPRTANMLLCDDNGHAVKSSKEGLTWTNGQLSLAPEYWRKSLPNTNWSHNI